jgi:hypothetical protein
MGYLFASVWAFSAIVYRSFGYVSGQATGAGGGEQVVAGEVDHLVGGAQQVGTARQNQVDQGQQARVGQVPLECCAQDCVVDGGEKLLHIKLKGVAVAARKVLRPVEGGVGAFARAAGVAVEDKARFPDWLQQGAERVMDDAVAEGGGADDARLAVFGDAKAAVASGAVGCVLEFVGKLEQVRFVPQLEGGDIRAAALAFACPTIGRIQVRKVVHRWIEMLVGFGHCG